VADQRGALLNGIYFDDEFSRGARRSDRVIVLAAACLCGCCLALVVWTLVRP
jgi:hypothetical protein